MLGIHDVDPININDGRGKHKIQNTTNMICCVYCIIIIIILFINFGFVTFNLEFIFCILIIKFVVWFYTVITK